MGDMVREEAGDLAILFHNGNADVGTGAGDRGGELVTEIGADQASPRGRPGVPFRDQLAGHVSD